MIIVNCSYSSKITNPRLTSEERTAAMKECADAGCVRCRNGYYSNGPVSDLPPEELCEGDPDLEDEHAAIDDPNTVNAALEHVGRHMGRDSSFREGHLETGPIQFGEDWPGVFIRGKHAIIYGVQLEVVLDALIRLGKDKQPLETIFIEKVLRGLVSDLKSCAVGVALEIDIKKLKTVEECRRHE